MALRPGTRLGPYEIAAPLGAGGVGEVYRARGTRLGRDVAIKVLPADLTATPEARARFEREARAISHLDHPNICTLLDVGREGEIDYLVMELVSGGSLRDRMARKALPLEQVLDLGVQIADALEAAHARGIVHRDLRPGNVLLTEQGQVKVTGFGLATPGQTVGAAAYMSPEQARGDEVDARSDVFSLGSVLYGMASGRRAFGDSSTAVTFEAILNRTPAPASELRQGVPAELDRIIGKALETDRELRYQTAGEVRSDLKRLKRDLESSRGGAASAGGGSGSRAWGGTAATLPASVIARRRLIGLAWTTAACLALVGAALVAIRLARREPAHEAVRLSIPAPPSAYGTGTLRISPDGHYLAFVALDSTGQSQVWIRPMDGTAARPLPGTEGGSTPFWSPDSRFIGFVSGDMIRKIEVAGGQPTTICDRKLRTGALGVGSWGTTGTILLDDIEIWAISSSGGQPVQAAWPDRSRGEGGCGWPEFLPDGNHFLYLAGIEGKPDSTALRLGRLNSKESKILAVGDFSRVEYVPPGYVLYLRGRTLLARPFDAERLRMTGDAIPVVDDVLRADTAGFAEFSASATGTLVYSDDYTWEGKKRLVWLDRKGREFGTLGPPGHYWATIAQSPDKKRVAVSFTAPGEFNPDIWMLDIVRNVATRFTSDPGGEFWPVWSPDGATVYFYAMRLGTYRVWMKPASGIGEERELPMPPGDAAPQAVTPDGRFLLSYWGQPGGHPSGKYDIVKTSLNANPHTTPLGISSRALGTGPLPHSLSPDGKWIAYFSFESGRAEVYVVDFPGLTGKWRVSVDGGQWPRWSPSGKELFFVAPGGKLMSAPVSTVPTFHVGRLDRVLEATPKILVYAPISGGDRFLAAVDAKDEKLPPTKVVLDWQAAVGRR